MWLFQPYCWMRSLTRPSWWVSLHSKTMWWTIQARLEKEWRNQAWDLCSLTQRMSSRSWEAEAVGNQVFLWRILGAVNSEGEGNMYSSSQPNWEGLHGDESGCGNQLHRTEAAEDWERSWLSGQKSHFHSHQKSHFHSHWCVRPDIASVERELASCHLHLPKD